MISSSRSTRFSAQAFRALRSRVIAVGVVALVWNGPVVSAQERVAGAGTMPAMVMDSGVDVLTRSYNIGRTGANTRETELTPDLVAGGLRKLFSLPAAGGPDTLGDPRIEAQPLIVTNIKMNDGKVHNVVYVCTMDNHVWTFDADTGIFTRAADLHLIVLIAVEIGGIRIER